ncbi:aromatic amino acid ammonia-lyase [Nocardia aurantiaca]|uniref:aromatic amino acid ammonia-lyase n=1 Tax=Nocardia aurantiaca TaxID=2675850 RepID=UPI0018AC13D1|nr:aromatic amino acid ammonia-lyase [Nocardia aurantiaca]
MHGSVFDSDPSTSALDPIARWLARTGRQVRFPVDPDTLTRLVHSRRVLDRVAARTPVYGLTRGFGPLVDFDAHTDTHRSGSGLIDHLTVGQGDPLTPEVVRTMIWLRLSSMAKGYSAVSVPVWETLVAQWNHGITPVVPRDGSLSASGDLVPLAHAAAALAGRGKLWWHDQGCLHALDADDALARTSVTAVRWDARSALAFVNGTSAALAATLHNHVELACLVVAMATATGRLVTLLGSNVEPYRDALSRVRNQRGQQRIAAVIRSNIDPTTPGSQNRPLQEPYSLRCAPQILGAVLDQLRLQGEILLAEADGTTDNPVIVDDTVLHGGNFHAAAVGLASEQYAGCVHQVAFLAERQLALLVDPARNGGLPPLLTPTPGRSSGLAGVQIAASSHLAAIRQHGYPASLTALPTNLGNQDCVPLALNSANAVTDSLARAWWIVGSLHVGIVQYQHLSDRARRDTWWDGLADAVPPIVADRPMHADIVRVAELVRARFLPTIGAAPVDHLTTPRSTA